MTTIQIRPLYAAEWEPAMDLAWQTFIKFEADDYSAEGIENFREFIRNPQLKQMFLEGSYQAWGAFYRGEIIGVLSIRNRSHISLLFVREDMHHKGVATSLIQTVFAYERDELGMHEVTVNAAPYAIGFYHKVGFKDLESEKTVEGIRYTPMIAKV